MPEVTLVEAVNLALARAMDDDPTVVVLGEDVGATAACSALPSDCSSVSDRSACWIRQLPNSSSADSASAWPRKA